MTPTMPRATALISALLALLAVASAFQPHSITRAAPRSAMAYGVMRRRGGAALRMSNSDQPPKEEMDVAPKGSTDWDAEWSKIARGETKVEARPEGMEVSEADLALKKLKRTAVEAQRAAASQMPAVKTPKMSKLQNDWRFWAAVILGVSLLSSAFSAIGQASMNSGMAPDQIMI
eukprot:CAMPEP_0182538890 /NCGR_PEP_ID=MMETSP1323-20130603/24447_1 /TAXON_ID=236787 /ORGANISM="Florenciella parvula, Strain RCC1693" /LENGTH=174 /DNA_ID=CAMNT_0024749397 /DNA_START=15 /DNA_END=539 /DNA_ORIENTATION=+